VNRFFCSGIACPKRTGPDLRLESHPPIIGPSLANRRWPPSNHNFVRSAEASHTKVEEKGSEAFKFAHTSRHFFSQSAHFGGSPAAPQGVKGTAEVEFFGEPSTSLSD
jgi:hypothetical protein